MPLDNAVLPLYYVCIESGKGELLTPWVALPVTEGQYRCGKQSLDDHGKYRKRRNHGFATL